MDIDGVGVGVGVVLLLVVDGVGFDGGGGGILGLFCCTWLCVCTAVVVNGCGLWV